MSTYLQLSSAMRREASISGTGPAAVTNQTGEYERVVNWVKDAWTEIQNRHQDWRWLRSRFTVNTTASDDTYAGTDCTDEISSSAITRFARWWPLDEAGYQNTKCFLVSAGVGTECWLTFMPWFAFRAMYKIGTQNNSTPQHFSIDPQNNLVLGPKPNGIFTVSGEYQKSAQVLAADADTPEMPARFHMLIVYEAMKKYAGYQSAPEVMQRGIAEGNKVMRQLEADQKPMPLQAAPLA